jgi:hypothetical protein
MAAAIDKFDEKRGATFSFVLNWEATTDVPAMDGTETVTCDLKTAENGAGVPLATSPVIDSIPSTWDAAGPYWYFYLSSAETLALEPGNYIFDVKVVFSATLTVITEPVVLELDQSVT